MPDTVENQVAPQMTIRHLGRFEQIGIYFGKMLRMFVYQNDWKVLPMAAIIAGLVGMVIKSMLFVSMEGTLMGAFALVMVCVWNGCFNSIQVISVPACISPPMLPLTCCTSSSCACCRRA